jgi:hypothetical protein
MVHLIYNGWAYGQRSKRGLKKGEKQERWEKRKNKEKDLIRALSYYAHILLFKQEQNK